MRKNKKNGKNVYLIICIVSGLIALAAVASILVLLIQAKHAEDDYRKLAQTVHGSVAEATQMPEGAAGKNTSGQKTEAIPSPIPQPVDIPIDFKYLRSQNSDVIGWINVPGTDIDYPVLYDTSDDLYYLSHTYTGTYNFAGSIFVLDDNTDNFTDFNTVVYGHNMASGAMFAQLHRFEKKDFFDEHNTIVLYTPESKLTYRIFAAYRTDNLNIMQNNDFSTSAARSDYIAGIYEHSYANFDHDVAVTADDRIVTLSTCIGNAAYRYVVQGELTSNEPGVYGG
jgi:sortase, SrtB family